MAIPQRKGEAEVLIAITDTCQPIFVPAVDTAAGMVVGKVMPGITIGAVIFTHGAPSALAEIGPPMFPIRLVVAIFQ